MYNVFFRRRRRKAIRNGLYGTPSPTPAPTPTPVTRIIILSSGFSSGNKVYSGANSGIKVTI